MQCELNGRLISRPQQRMPEISHVEYLMLVDCGDDVAIPEPTDPRWFSRIHLERQHATVTFETEAGHDARRDGDRCKTEVRAVNGTTYDHGLDMGVNGTHRKRVTNRLRRRSDDDIDADDLTRQVYQRASAVPGIDRGVSLNQIVQGFAIRCQHGS